MGTQCVTLVLSGTRSGTSQLRTGCLFRSVFTVFVPTTDRFGFVRFPPGDIVRVYIDADSVTTQSVAR
jgi:hypothetical protein